LNASKRDQVLASIGLAELQRLMCYLIRKTEEQRADGVDDRMAETVAVFRMLHAYVFNRSQANLENLRLESGSDKNHMILTVYSQKFGQV